ncbi:hypothetical protein T261_0796 [Streptomyces lydicus]|nr:hypothetical protein T261_0796 [Streptomyces lydicus]
MHALQREEYKALIPADAADETRRRLRRNHELQTRLVKQAGVVDRPSAIEGSSPVRQDTGTSKWSRWLALFGGLTSKVRVEADAHPWFPRGAPRR